MSFQGPLSAPPTMTHQYGTPITFNDNLVASPQEYIRRQREHYASLLEEKWECQLPNHNHVICVPTKDGQHFSFEEAHLEKWINALCDGTSTTADPPHAIFDSINGGPVFNHVEGEFGVEAVALAPSRCRPGPRRPVNKTSARSIDSSIAATQKSTSKIFIFRTHDKRGGSSTTASSGVPGPGYYGGKALKWLGESSLGAISDAVSNWRGNNHINCLQKWRKHEHPMLGPEVREKVFEMLGDALEWSRQCYTVNVNNMAYRIGREVQRWLQPYPDILPASESYVWLIHVHISLIPTLLTRISRDDPLAGDLAFQTLSILTKTPLAFQGCDTVADVVRLVARELAYSRCSYQHSWLGVWLLRIMDMCLKKDYLTPDMLNAIQELVFRRQHGLPKNVNRPWEVPLFAQCASRDPSLRNVVLGPHGLPSLINALDRMLANDVDPRRVPWEEVALTLRALAFLSEQGWVVENVEPGIMHSLLRVFEPSIPERWFCVRFWAADTIRNMVALRPELTRTLREKKANIAFATLCDPQLDLQLSSPSTAAKRSVPSSNLRRKRDSEHGPPTSPLTPTPPSAPTSPVSPTKSAGPDSIVTGQTSKHLRQSSSSSSTGHTMPGNVFHTSPNSSETGHEPLSSSPRRATSDAYIAGHGSMGPASPTGAEGRVRTLGRRFSLSLSPAAKPNRRGSIGNYRARLLEDYKREAMKRAEELAEYVRAWTEWAPDKLPMPRLEVASEGVGWIAQFEGMGWAVEEGGVMQETGGGF